ncbi:hypothetical protein L1987_61005 [Smallanthus sonchifolius]|uniref:Uncharacterized protein n=1 Tax=Smallanthus sonchifolius TaxID=185202 RepID=A0ACB9D9L0_9ASTR|nr:hypothetical protein L1987_61005 [Smallanthus sonchifolius]
MDGQILLGKELRVVFAEENRKKPADMKARERAALMIIKGLPPVIFLHQSPPRGRSYHGSRGYPSPPRRDHYLR